MIVKGTILAFSCKESDSASAPIPFQIDPRNKDGNFILGKTGTRIEYTLLILLPFLLPVYFYITEFRNIIILLPFLSLPLIFPLIGQINGGYNGEELNKTLANTAKLSLIFSILFSFGLVLS